MTDKYRQRERYISYISYCLKYCVCVCVCLIEVVVIDTRTRTARHAAG